MGNSLAWIPRERIAQILPAAGTASLTIVHGGGQGSCGLNGGISPLPRPLKNGRFSPSSVRVPGCAASFELALARVLVVDGATTKRGRAARLALVLISARGLLVPRHLGPARRRTMALACALASEARRPHPPNEDGPL